MTGGGRGLRIALAGATGALGDEVVAVLSERRFPLAAFHPFATERSLGREIEIGDEIYGVRDEPPSFAEVDLLIVATPTAVAAELVRAALRASVACIDCSGAMLSEEAVCVALPEQSGVAEAVGSPLCALPPGPALGWSYALAPLHEAAGITSVSAVALRGASHVGVQGMELLSEHTIAILNSQDPPEQQVLPGAVAFDALPWVEPGDGVGGGATRAEDAAAVGLRRGLRAEFPVAVTAVRVPTFVGDGTALQVRFGRALPPAEAIELLEKAPCVRLDDEGPGGASLRDSAGSDEVHVARIRSDPTDERGLLLWTSSDSLRLCAASAVRLAELRLTLN